ncbi:MAG TPA: alpha-glucan family phosphorylase, partial [Thermodesulfobacteriota bacterium]|nr:alpha-glucan family phosphorylase [Thermodesulfobacteriota bacterium]
MKIITSEQLPRIAYFSMEIGLASHIPTYSGGLGVLAGDTLRSAADLGLPMVGLTLVYRKGYFRQHLDEQGNQTESPVSWNPEKFFSPMEPMVTVSIAGRPVRLKAWRYEIHGISGHKVPIFFLDTNLPENSPYDQTLTDHLYGGDDRYRLCQEVILGMGGLALLAEMGIRQNVLYHMNEGHSALLALSLLKSQTQKKIGSAPSEAEIEAVRQQCVFTTHTPVPAGHDIFSWDVVAKILEEEDIHLLKASNCCLDGNLNMTYLALRFAGYINGVAMRHGEISTGMFPDYPINAISNGVHALTWTSAAFAELYDRRIPEWRNDNFYLRYAVGLSLDEIWQAHAQAKKDLLDEVEKRTGLRLAEKVMTIGFARRATTYKRQDLLFSDRERLQRLAQDVGPLQVIYAGKAHPRDEGGKDMIRRVFAATGDLGKNIKLVYLENYDMTLGKIICGGVDLWLNTPLRPLEASGTSGMKAALNGVPSLSILDGWWIEGHMENVTGWSIG